MVVEDEYSHIKQAKNLLASTGSKHTGSYRCNDDICFVVSESGYWYDAHQRWLEMDRCWLRSCASTPSSLWYGANMLSLEDEDLYFGSNSHSLAKEWLFLGKVGFWVFVQIVTVLSSQTVLKWWGENPEKAPNSARQLRSLGHWWSLVRCLVTRPRNCSTQFFIFYETRIPFCHYLIVCFATFPSLWWREGHQKQKSL